MKTGANKSVNAIFYEKQKKSFCKTLMKNKYLIAKYSGKA